MYYEAMWGMHSLWWVFWIAVVIALVFWGRGGSLSGREPPARETPHELLRRRFAKGEIDAQEYENRKAVLDKDS